MNQLGGPLKLLGRLGKVKTLLLISVRKQREKRMYARMLIGANILQRRDYNVPPHAISTDPTGGSVRDAHSVRRLP